MTARSRLGAVLLVLASSSGVACHHHHGEHSELEVTTRRDSTSGIVSITGTSFEQHIMLHTADGELQLNASASDSAALSRVGGTSVLVRGRAREQAFYVVSFTVTSVDGAPVADGVLARDGGHLMLERTNGQLTLGNPPAALDSLVGARIWISGPLDTGPNSYGVIVPAR